MKLAFNLSFFLFSFFLFSNELLSLTDYQIKKICQKERRYITCKKDLQEKRSNLEKGNFIEIPVKPYKR